MVTKSGPRHWHIENLRSLLRRHTYTGIKYYNTRYYEKKSDDPLRQTKYGKKVFRDESEWIAVKVPEIISKELFDKAQARPEANQKKYNKPREVQLLSNLVTCGRCGSFYMAYQRYCLNHYRYRGEVKS